jgi:hypothetical protein
MQVQDPLARPSTFVLLSERSSPPTGDGVERRNVNVHATDSTSARSRQGQGDLVKVKVNHQWIMAVAT